MSNERHYWLHRVSHEGGLRFFAEESRITIGFSDAAAVPEVGSAIDNHKYDDFCIAYKHVYNGNIERSKNSLWRFAVEMSIGDWVIVPCPWGFYVCEVTGMAEISNRRGLDIGWEREVKRFGDVLSPREDFANISLLSRMKCRQTNLCIDDLKDAVVSAKERKRLNLVDDLSEKLLSSLNGYGKPEGVERLVASVFEAMGAEVQIMPKNYSDKKGDCDVEAVIPTLRLVVSVQCKKHAGQTDASAILQIAEYSEARLLPEGWMHWKWVVSTADGFTPEAENKARENNIRLIAGKEFARMLLNAGLKG